MAYQLIYVSAASSLMSDPELAQLLVHARQKNHRLRVNGLLIHQRGSFLQVLEGESATVEALFQPISHDPRHRRIAVLSREPDARPIFHEWSMGFVDTTTPSLAQVDGFRDLSRGRLNAGSLTSIRSRAFFLIDAFSVGRLHQHVSV
jgi:hypothetical protein